MGKLNGREGRTIEHARTWQDAAIETKTEHARKSIRNQASRERISGTHSIKNSTASGISPNGSLCSTICRGIGRFCICPCLGGVISRLPCPCPCANPFCPRSGDGESLECLALLFGGPPSAPPGRRSRSPPPLASTSAPPPRRCSSVVRDGSVEVASPVLDDEMSTLSPFVSELVNPRSRGPMTSRSM